MRALDTGLLACAVNRHVPEHARASRVLDALANGEPPWAIPWTVAHAFLALVTHPHAVARPLASEDAWAFLERLMESSSLRMLGPGPRHAAVMAELVSGLGAEHGLPAGLGTAAILREHGVRELLSADRGMRRYGFLTVRDPLHGPPWSPGEAPARRYRVLRPPKIGGTGPVSGGATR